MIKSKFIILGTLGITTIASSSVAIYFAIKKPKIKIEKEIKTVIETKTITKIDETKIKELNQKIKDMENLKKIIKELNQKIKDMENLKKIIKELNQKIKDIENLRRRNIIQMSNMKDNFTRHVVNDEKLSKETKFAYWSVIKKMNQINDLNFKQLNILNDENIKLKKIIANQEKNN